MAQASFYTVNGPRGVYYAVRNHDTGMVWTERTDHAAHDQARDEGLTLVNEQTISHAQLLDLMIPQSKPSAATTPAGAEEPTRPSLRIETGLTRLLKRFRRDDNTSTAGKR